MDNIQDITEQCIGLIEALDEKYSKDINHSVIKKIPDVSCLDINTLTDLIELTRKKINSQNYNERTLNSKNEVYGSDFYDEQWEKSIQSAREVIPVILSLINPSSVVDLGCGIGTWLAAFCESGVKDVLGVDGQWVEKSRLQIPGNQFMYCDLETPVSINRRFDLAISVEVAEHLESSSSDTFVNSLCNLAPVVCFSAAIPFQGGANHVNERWPSYWIEKFSIRGYECVDCLRCRLLSNDKVQPYYAQNIMFFCSQDGLSLNPNLYDIYLHQQKYGGLSGQAIVHPKAFLGAAFNDQVLSYLLK